MSFRLLLSVAMFGSALFVWWIGAIFALALCLRYRAWEVVLFGVLLDILWLPSGAFYGIPVATGVALVTVWALEPLRRQFMFDYV
jgi:hypothetical protein